jgi:hypothetical protein
LKQQTGSVGPNKEFQVREISELIKLVAKNSKENQRS